MANIIFYISIDNHIGTILNIYTRITFGVLKFYDEVTETLTVNNNDHFSNGFRFLFKLSDKTYLLGLDTAHPRKYFLLRFIDI